MLERKIDSYIRHFYANTKKALLLTGARQTGKTYNCGASPGKSIAHNRIFRDDDPDRAFLHIPVPQA